MALILSFAPRVHHGCTFLFQIVMSSHNTPSRPRPRLIPLIILYKSNPYDLSNKRRIPFYYAFKLAFLVYLGYPGWNGATIIYNNFLKARPSLLIFLGYYMYLICFMYTSRFSYFLCVCIVCVPVSVSMYLTGFIRMHPTPP